MPNIVTDKLLIYYHAKQGFNGNKWSNIAPNMSGRYDGTVNGCVLQTDSIYFDGVDDRIDIPIISATDKSTIYEIEIYFKSPFDGKPTDDQGTFTYALFSNLYVPAPEMFQFSAITIDAFGLNALGTYARVNYSFMKNSLIKCNYFFDTVNKKDAIYINDTLVDSGIDNGNGLVLNDLSSVTSIIGAMNYDRLGLGIISFFKGNIYSFKLYKKQLSDTERKQNTSVGVSNVGLNSDPPPQSNPPLVTIISVDNLKISKILGFDISTVKFKFDKDVTEWRINLQGSSYDTGVTLYSSASPVSANNEILGLVYGTNLFSEGENRVNIYGKDSSGNWTPYNS